MPAQPQWLLRIPEILEDLERVSFPVLDRSAFERLFRVRRRRAIDLLSAFGGYQAGRTFLVERNLVIAKLRQVLAGEQFYFERCRRERLGAAIETLEKERRAARVSIAPPLQVPGLPAGVRLAAGRMTIDFSSVEDLLGKLYGVAQAASADFAKFEALAQPTSKQVHP